MTVSTHLAVALPVDPDAEHVCILIAEPGTHTHDRIVMVDGAYARAFARELIAAADESDRRRGVEPATVTALRGSTPPGAA